MLPLGKVTERFDQLLTWIGVYTLATAVLSALAKQLKALAGYGWAEAIFVGLGAAAVLLAVISFGLVAWRFFHPIRSPLIATPNQAEVEKPNLAGADDVAELRKVVAALEEASRYQVDLYKKLREASDYKYKYRSLEGLRLSLEEALSKFNERVNGETLGDFWIALMPLKNAISLASSAQFLGVSVSSPLPAPKFAENPARKAQEESAHLVLPQEQLFDYRRIDEQARLFILEIKKVQFSHAHAHNNALTNLTEIFPPLVLPDTA